MSDQLTSKAGTITSGEDRFMEWKSKNGETETSQVGRFDIFLEGIFQKGRLLDIIKNFICFNNDGINSYKILAGYHQYFAVRKAVERTKLAVSGDGKIGVFWHTQGSGKSLSMVFYAHLFQQAIDSPTIVVITDRNDLDNQLYGQFCNCKDFLRQEPVQAENREHLKQLLEGRKANGIIFTTMQKFEESDEPLSDRKNIIVKELTETLRKNKTIDWQKKETARARMRMIVKKLLKKYKYPPEGQEDALKTVISQCELWTDNVTDYEDTVSYSINDDYGNLKVAETTSDYGK